MPEIRRIDSSKIACIEEKGSYFQLNELFEQLKSYLDFRHVSYKPEHFAIIYDIPGERNMAKVHMAAGLELAGEALGNGEVIIVTRSSGWMACDLHRGTFETLPETHQRLTQWIQSQGYRIAGPAYEYFSESVIPGKSGVSSQVMVEIQYPVEKVGA